MISTTTTNNMAKNSASSPNNGSGSSGGNSGAGPGSLALYEFLVEAELDQYFDSFHQSLKISSVSQLKYVKDDDLNQIGLSKPEQRRLRKHFTKYFPQIYFKKIKQLILPKQSKHAVQLPLPTSMISGDGGGVGDGDDPLFANGDHRKDSVSQHIIPAQSISIHKQLGVGEFGVVQQGVWTPASGQRVQVAIKCLSKQRMQTNPLDFLKEAAILHAVDHEHIVRLFGVVLDGGQLMLVTELAPMKSLHECLRQESLRSEFTVRILCDFARQICNGMEHLESRRLIHRDLAARNILVFSRDRVKISDFGLSRALNVGKDYYQTNFNLGLKLPIAWCAPECILYLKFTSASDVWAYAVTLWEMFSYGLQPWASLTGQQILETIDQPNCGRLDQPACCPADFYHLMLRCWNHQPEERPRFEQLVRELPDCRPELVQAVQETNELDLVAEEQELLKSKHVQTGQPESKTCRFLRHKRGDVITVLDRKPSLIDFGLSLNSNYWKGTLDTGETGLFNPNNTVAYLGQHLPSTTNVMRKNGTSSSSTSTSSNTSSNNHGNSSLSSGSFIRSILDKNLGSSSNGGNGIGSSYASRRKLRPEMISRPQGDLKHTGHVGADGAYFGDISCLGERYQHLPRNVEESESMSLSRNSSDLSDRAPLLVNHPKMSGNSNGGKLIVSKKSNLPLKNLVLNGPSLADSQHEYHEISDDEDKTSTCTVLDSPKFDQNIDFGPSLMDEVFKELDLGLRSELFADSDKKMDVRNDLKELFGRNMKEKPDNREMAGKVSTVNDMNGDGNGGTIGKKKHHQLSPVFEKTTKERKFPSSEQHTLDQAIAMAKELANKAIEEMDGPSMHLDSPRTPRSPTKKKFTFNFKSSAKEHKSFHETLARNSECTFDSILSDDAKEAYESLVEKGMGDGMEKSEILNEHSSRISSFPSSSASSSVLPSSSALMADTQDDCLKRDNLEEDRPEDDECDSNPLRMLRSGVGVVPKVRGNRSRFSAGPQTASLARLTANAARSSLPAPPPVPKSNSLQPNSDEIVVGNPLPLPPRDRTKSSALQSNLRHHERRHPLSLTGNESETSTTTTTPITVIPTNASFTGNGLIGKSSTFTTTAANGIHKPIMSTFKPNMPLRKSLHIGDPQLLPSSSTASSIIASAAPIAHESDVSSLSATVAITANTAAATGATIKSNRSLGDRNHQNSSIAGISCLSSPQSPPNQPPPLPPPPPPPLRTSSSPLPPLPPSSLSITSTIVSSDTVDGRSFNNKKSSDLHHHHHHHVSSEDLTNLSAAKHSPTTANELTRSHVDSDEVRAMQKVLAKDVHISVEECNQLLNRMDGDVLKAIKCVRLRETLRKQEINIDCDWAQVLQQFNWNIRLASSHLINSHSSSSSSSSSSSPLTSSSLAQV